MSNDTRVILLACSGIGKTYGSVGREAMYQVLEDLRPNETQTVCLSLLTLGDHEAQARIRNALVITIDGCPFKCAQVNVEHAGGGSQISEAGSALPQRPETAIPAAVFRVFDVYRAHKELKVRSVSELGESGAKMAEILANAIAAKVDELRASPQPTANVVVNEIAACAAAPQAGEK
jgi:hypothetical protein